MTTIELRQIPSTSPTLAETMRACLLRAAISRAAGSSDFVLGNPKAWLGTAYHEVLERVGGVYVNEETPEVVERLWNEAVTVQQQRAAAHVLDHRFGAPTTWPGYYVARASVLLRAQDLATKRPFSPQTVREPSFATSVEPIREQKLTAFGGRLVGQPDMIRSDEVVDYKSGAIFEQDAGTDSDIVKAAYVRQLRIYGYLVKHNLGWWPRRGILLPIGGNGVEVALEPSDCEREAGEAVALLDAYNEKVRSGVAPSDFASPSVQACRWCPYKLICPFFWQTATPEWSGQLDGAAVEGSLVNQPSSTHNNAARAITVDVRAGTETRCQAQIAPLNPLLHPAVQGLSKDEAVRVVGLRVRPNGSLRPSERTVLFRIVDLPSLATTHT